MSTTIYGFKESILTIGGRIVQGMASDSGWTFAYDVDAYTKVVDHDGRATRVKSANRNGKLTINLLQSSELNDYFMSLAAADLASNTGVVPVFAKDTLGTTLITCAEAWVTKVPDAQFQDSLQNRVWVFDCAETTVFLGGSNSLSAVA